MRISARRHSDLHLSLPCLDAMAPTGSDATQAMEAIVRGAMELGSGKMTARQDCAQTPVRSTVSVAGPRLTREAAVDVADGAKDEYLDRYLGAAVSVGKQAPQARQKSVVRSTFPGGTTFKALCNSYLRKYLRGQAPQAIYWVAKANLANGDRVLARLRLTVALEDVRVVPVAESTQIPAAIEFVVGAAIHPAHGN